MYAAPRSFQVQPETNNSVTLWIKDYPLHVLADNRDLVITFDTDEFEVKLSDNGVRIQRIRKHPTATIEETSGSVDSDGGST